jgi:release factor glutamine methyltransferase
VQYLLGYREFFLLQLEVTPAVLIPRPETEVLVTEALNRIKSREAPRVLDVGTGSGCIAIAIAHRHKSAQVAASDISGEALDVARRNAARHQLAERIRFVHGDLFDPLGDDLFDLIVSNPPYISAPEFEKLAPQVREFEPKPALDGGPDGFSIFDRLIPAALSRLVPGGVLALEIGSCQEDGVRQRLIDVGLKPAPTIRDGQRLPRVVLSQK